MKDDVISRHAAIEAIEQLNIPEDMCVFEILSHIQLAIGTLPSAQPRWIPCEERLPEEDTDVLVTVYFAGLTQTSPSGWKDHIKPNYYVDVARYFDGNWSSYSDEYKVAANRHKVVAWLPLPEAYKGGQDD